MAKWVQHISGQGEKWEVLNDEPQYYWVVQSKVSCAHYDLPKNEYTECPAPEELEDVTDECVWSHAESNLTAAICHVGREETVCDIYNGYRLRKVRLAEPRTGITRNAFIIERKKQ